ncbi:GNAT family N-acetyltransferase [Mycobacterium talmoniae]|uniref:N-acetyltransferase domain-containing protein n=1 Tax=Mycobacterium talmoniae TaxID=1858794 RepID=A0A1S1NPB2_9MYCO|nr:MULTISPECIES: GNAT family N-acetyltransferase [Mycobacterium]OHV06074.1 hypothetical protein BKN37_03545 [Mycobacterium talmoniae]
MPTSALPPPPELAAGPDVLLRCPVVDDVDGMVEQCVDPETQRWISIPVPYTASDAREFVDRATQAWQAGTVATFAIVYRGRFAGSLDLRMDGVGGAEVGFGLAPWARGSGVMSRALRRVLAWAFDELQLELVHWKAQVGNWASRRTATRCGFRVAGTVPGLLEHRGQRCDGWFGLLRRGDPLTGDADVEPAGG